MIQLKIKTEYSFRKAFGKIANVVEACEGDAVAITDNGTWGYVKFYKVCKRLKKKPIFGISLDIVRDRTDKIQYSAPEVTILAKNLAGLEIIYKLVSLSWDRKYYTNRIYYSDLYDLCDDNVIIIANHGCNIEKLKNLDNLYLGINPNSPCIWIDELKEYENIPKVVTSDNSYTYPDDEPAYEMFIGDYLKSGCNFITNESKTKAYLEYYEEEWFSNTHKIANEISTFELPKARNVVFDSDVSLESMCRDGLLDKNIKWNDIYEKRLKRELSLIKEKNFEDYFFVIADLIKFAKTKMLVGPGRGSSAGSLVCFLLGITAIDPIEHGLIFERFIDINRDDLPDIDIDFPDTKRRTVINYLKRKYGNACVAHIGTISQYKTRSILTELGKHTNIPFEDIDLLKNEIETINGSKDMELYKDMLDKHPALIVAEKIEDHSRHSGKHAAGIIVLNDDVRKYCSLFDTDIAEIDKKDAEFINILKIDVLGLRTLSVIDDCLRQISMSHNKLSSLQLDDSKTFEIFNKGMLSGIFQFEGDTVKNLTKKMPVDCFNDLVALTTVARPGALHSGGAAMFINRRNGTEDVVYVNKFIEKETKETFGVMIYQEQVMAIARNMAGMSWGDVSRLRKLISKTGEKDDLLDQFGARFVSGAIKSGINKNEASLIWHDMRTFGAYGFNKSHAVCYALVSYWCAWLKAHYPLEFAISCLRNSSDEGQTIKILRELVNEGFQYIPFDCQTSQSDWSVQKGVLVGGLCGIKGIGPKAAEDILNKRKNGLPLLPGQKKKLENPDIYYQDVFECNTRFGEYYKSPEKFNIRSGIPVSYIKDIDDPGDYIFIGKLSDYQIKNLNDYPSFVKDNKGRIEENVLFINMLVEDDTDQIKCTINRWQYSKLGKIVEQSGKKDYFLFRGTIAAGKNYRKIYLDNMRILG